MGYMGLDHYYDSDCAADSAAAVVTAMAKQLEKELEEKDWSPCLLECGDSKCREWSDVFTEEIDGERYNLCHVSECQMLDEPWKEEDNEKGI